MGCGAVGVSTYFIHIASSSFLTAWKNAIVVPLPKSGAPTSLADFRPISILPVLQRGLRGFCVISSLNILSLVVFCHVLSLVPEDFTIYGYCFDEYYG
jgi:hypothetical protein